MSEVLVLVIVMSMQEKITADLYCKRYMFKIINLIICFEFKVVEFHD